MMTAEAMKELLKKEYGIGSPEELYKEMESYQGVDIGLFAAPVERRVSNDKE